MRRISPEEAMRRAAEKVGVSVEALRSEIELSIAEAMNSPNPQAREHWKNIPRQGSVPTPEEVIVYIVEKLK